MNREERIKRQTAGWLRRTNFCYGKVRAGNAPVSQHAVGHMMRKPYTSKAMVREVETEGE